MTESKEKWLPMGLTIRALALRVLLISTALALFFFYLGTVLKNSRETLDPTAYRGPQGDIPAHVRQRNVQLKDRYSTVYPEGDLRKILYQDQDFAVVESRLSEAYSKIHTELGALDYSILTRGLASIRHESNGEEMDRVLKRWCKKRPDSVYPWLVRGKFLIEYAWYWRGAGRPEEVHTRNQEKYDDLMDSANEALIHAGEIGPEDPESWNALIAVAMARGLDRDTMETYYGNVLRLCPHHFIARTRKLLYLSPGWQGSRSEMMEFVSECDQLKAQFPLLGILRAHAYELLGPPPSPGTESEFEKEEIWDEVMEAFEAVFQRYPEALMFHYRFVKLAMLGGRYAEAAKHLDILGEVWTLPGAWDTLPDYHRDRVFGYAHAASDTGGPLGEAYILKALKAAPNNSIVRYHQGLFLLNEGRYEEAQKALFHSLALNSAVPETYLAVSRLMGEQEKYAQALRYAKRALDSGAKKSTRKTAKEYIRLYGSKLDAGATLDSGP